MLIVLDTNVLISGVLNPNGVPGQIVKQVLARVIRLAVDRRILGEYHAVTERPHLKINPLDRQTTLAAIDASSLRTDSQPLDLSPKDVIDPKDLPFAEVAVASHAQFLVTGNRKHFGFMQRFNIPVLSPAEFIEKIQDDKIEG